ncbi:glycoside hydrolase family 88 protein [Mariniphaga sediminis]|uniref:glycoside hydrolase family 88 protein n=1 Tax=Mariniphaga sediminis TaxID=1628158 RepID=UPI0035619000
MLQIKRRTFVEWFSLCSAGMLMTPLHGYPLIESKRDGSFKRVITKVISSDRIMPPEGKRVPFGWSAVGIAPGASVILKPEKTLAGKHFWLRLSVAMEIWDINLLKVSIPEVETCLGTMDIRFSSVLVPYELKIDAKHIEHINRYGLKITLDSSSPLWVFSEKARDADNRAFLPYILVADEESGTEEDFFQCMESLNTVQAFGWREGTVLDGLWQLYAQKGHNKALETIKQHLNLFFEGDNLHYETGASKPKLNEVDGIESTIPFATVARLDAGHPILKTVVEGWTKLKKSNGMIVDGSTISAEGCYTVAYPMAVIGKAWNDKELMMDALEQLKHRFALYTDNILYLRYHNTSGKYTFPNWARGAAWNLLGFARTMSELNGAMEDKEVIQKFQEGIKLALSMQRSNGLWGCFMHKPDSLPDTSGSAGIAAAILIGIRNGHLPEEYRQYANNCWNALQQYITPDGFLKSVAQDNRGGIEVQESDYRVIAQMGMGLMAQLYAAM